MFYPMKHLPSPEEAKILTAQLSEKTSESPGERRNRTREMLINGELVKRGLYVEDELRFLIDMIEQEGELRKVAAKALAHFVHSPPSEFTLSIETIGSAISKSKTGLQYLLDEAENGSFTLFKEIKPTEIELGEEIGSGTEACVMKAKWESRPIAIKKFRGIPSTTQFQRELSIMSLVQHPNLLRCYGGYSDTKKDEYYLVMDLMDTDVHAALHSPAANQVNSSPVSLTRSDPRSASPLRNSAPSPANTTGSKRTWDIRYPQMLKIALHTARGLEYLHDCNLIHRDLKSVNLLIDEHYNAKVCDFGLSRIIAPKNQNMTGNVGTVSWIAPEVFEKQPYDAKADVYSFGVVMWELYTKQVPFQDLNTFEIPIAVIKGERPAIPKECPKEYAKLMQSCWHKKPAKRPTFQKIVKSLLKLTKDNGLEAPGSPAPLLSRAAGGFSQSAVALRTRESAALYASTGSLEESATTSSSRSEEDGPDKNHKTGSGKVPPALSSFPRRRTASSAAIGSDIKSSSSPNIHSKRGSTIRASGDFKMVAELPEETTVQIS
jgi:serine/threonine protein kinase